MIISDMFLSHDDEINESAWGGLVVDRLVQFTVCRCRQCEDACEMLGEVPHTLCIRCNNHHSQVENGVYKGPLTGPRRVLERLAQIPADDPPQRAPEPLPVQPTYRRSLPGYLGGPQEACPICGTVPACQMDCR